MTEPTTRRTFLGNTQGDFLGLSQGAVRGGGLLTQGPLAGSGEARPRIGRAPQREAAASRARHARVQK